MSQIDKFLGGSSTPAAKGTGDINSFLDAKTPPRTLGAALNDTVIEVANAAAGGLSSAGNFIAPGNAASQWIDKNIVQAGEANQSDAVKAEKQRFRDRVDKADGVLDELGAVGSYVVNNPVLSAAQAVGSFVAPGAAVKAAGLAGRAAGLGAKGVELAGRAGGVAAGAALAGGDAAGTAYELAQKGGATEDQAVAAGRQASVIPALVGGAGGAFGAEKLLAGGKGFAGGAVSRAVKHGASEALQEGVEEGVTQYEGQRAAMPYDPSIDPAKGVAAAAGMGAVLGGMTGGGVSLLTGGHGAAEQVPAGQDGQAAVGGAEVAQGGEVADAAAPPAASGLDPVHETHAAQLQDLQAQEQGEDLGPQSEPPDGAAALAAQRAQAQAQRQAEMEASRAVESPDDEIYQSTGAAEPPRSVQMGLNPAAGPLSAGAALAVDSGAADQMQQALAAAQAAQAEGKGKKAAADAGAPRAQEPARSSPDTAEVDPTTGELAPQGMAAWSDAQLSAAFRSAQSQKVRLELAQELSRRRAERGEARPTEAARPAGAPAADTPAIAVPTLGEQRAQQIARESTEARRQRQLGASERWMRMTADERQAAAGQAQGLNVVARRNVHTRAWADLNEKHRAALMDVLAPRIPTSPTTEGSTNGPEAPQAQQAGAQPAQEGAAPAPAPAAAAEGLNDDRPTSPNAGAQAAPAAGAQAAQEGRAQRAERIDRAGEAWTRMPAAERQAVASRLEGVKPVIQKNLKGAQWENLNADLKRKIADAMEPAPMPAADAVPGRRAELEPARTAIEPQPKGAGGAGKETSHLVALEAGLARERARLRGAATDAERTARAVKVAQAEREVAGEREFLGLPPEQQLPDMSDEELAAELDAGPADQVPVKNAEPAPAPPVAEQAAPAAPAVKSGSPAPESVPQRMKRVKAEQATAAAPAPMSAPAKPKAQSKSVLAKLKEAQAARADYFTPGNIVKSYAGHDRVVSYSPPDGDGRWSVTVRAVQKEGDAWVDVPGERERVHGTQPDAKDIKAGPVERPAPIDRDAAVEPQLGLLERHNAVERGISAGTLDLEQYKQTFAALVQDEDATKAEISKLSKDDLLRSGGASFAYRYKGEKKDVIVNAGFNAMLETYALGRKYGSSSFIMSSGGLRAHQQAQEKALRELVANTTQEDLAARAAEIKAARAEIKARHEAAASALENPQTLQDYRGFMRHWMEKGDTSDAAFLRLTPEQRQQYDALEAESTREAREKAKADARVAAVRSAGGTTAGEVIATKHTKHGHDLFVVQLADRVAREDYETLNASARRLGGNYSSFRGNGAIPGFQFRTRESAEAFQKLVAGDTAAAREVAQARRDAFEDDKSQTAVERLRAMADAIDAGADEQLSRDRKVNTVRRARMAGAAEEAALNSKAFAATMRNLAAAIEAGKAPFLDGVRTKTQLSQLQQAIGAAKAKQLLAKYGSWAAAEQHKHEPADAQTVDFVEFPRFSMFRSDLAGLARQLLEIDGGKKLGAALAKVTDDVTDAYTEWAKANLHQVSQFGRAGQMAEFSNKADAERAIKRSGLIGKAVVLAVKRGQNRVVLSPGEAMQRGLWQGDGDKRINLSMDFVQDLVKLGKRRGSKAITIPWQLESTLEKRQRLQRMGIQTPAEYRSALRELVGLREAAQAPDRVKELERSMVGRQNDGLDFFPTGGATVESSVDAADIQPGMEVLEPSAGWGHIADYIREQIGVEPDVVELSGKRRELLEAKGYNLVGSDFMEFAGKQYDRIVMNPPFSDGRDIQHVQHAFSLLKPGGRLVAIMSESAFFQSNKRAEAFREWLDALGATNEKLPDGSFMDPSLPVNTGVSARMVVVDKPASAGPENEPTFRRGQEEAAGRAAVPDVGVEDSVDRADSAEFDVARFLDVMAQGERAAVSPVARREAVESTRAAVAGITRAWANGPEVVVAYDMADPAIPQAVRDADLQQRSGGAAGAPEGFYWNGKAYLLASALPSPQDAARVLYHEGLGHHGLRGAFGKELDQILNQVATMRRADVAAKAEAYGIDLGTEQGRRTAAEEVLAEMAEKTPGLHFVRRAVAAVRNFLRAHVPGFQGLALTDNDIIQGYILPARGWVERRSAAQADPSAPQFARHPGFSAAVDAAVKAGARGEAGERAYVEIGTLPQALAVAGVPAGDLKTSAKVLQKVVFDHGVTPSVLKRIPELLEKPVMVFRSATVAGRFVVVTSEMVRGAPLVVAISPETTRGAVALNFVPSLYPRDDLQAIQRWLNATKPGEQLLTYLDKEQSPAWFGSTRLQLPGEYRTTQGLQSRSVKTQADLVNAPPEGAGPLFSRAKFDAIKASALAQIEQSLSHPGTVSIWDKTVGTMRHLAERAPAFKPVFESAQRFIDDVSMLGNDAADAAPRLLPRVESWSDLSKKPITAADNKAIAGPLFEGTLNWGRDVDGTPMLADALAGKYRNMPAADKAQLMLRAGQLDAGVLKMWLGLPQGQFEANVNTRFDSKVLKPGVVWSDKELRDLFGLEEGQISLYREARAAIDRSIDMTARADMLRALGAEYAGLRDVVLAQETMDDAMEIVTRTLMDDARATPDKADRLLALNNLVVSRFEKAQQLMQEGYAPLSRFGRYTVDVVDAAGERQYFGMFETKADSNRMAEAMAKEFPRATITQGTMSAQAFKLFAGITPESLELFGNMLGLESEGNDARDKAFQDYLRLAKNNHSALKRLIHRKGIAGYSEDVGRVLASFVYSNARQAAGGLNAGVMESAINDIPKEQGELKDVAMGLQAYIRDPQEEGQAVRGMLFAQYLGGSLASAFVNTTQPFAVTLPWLTQFGGMRRAAGQMARALNDMRRSISDKAFSYEADLAAALQSAQDDGVVSPQEIHQLMAQARGAGALRTGDGTRAGDARAAAANHWERLKVAWGQPFALAEQFNRRSTFIAAYRLAKEQQIAEPSNFARRAVLETQFLYSKANKMRWARGAVGGTLLTFKTYSVSYLELMHRMWTQGGPEGKRAVGWAVAMLLLMGGAGGLPFMEDAGDLIDGGAQLMGYNLSTKHWRKQLLQDVVGKELAEFMEQGISGLPGAPIDVSGRLGMGNLLPGTGLLLTKPNRERDLLEIAGPAGDLVARGFTGARKLLTGDLSGAALEVSPTAVRNAAKGIDMATSGMYKDAKGYKVLDTTLPEAAAKFIGFQPKSVAEVQEANAFMLRTKSFYSQTSAEIKAQWADALFRKDAEALERVRGRLAAWNRDNPDQPIVVKMPDVWKRVREMGKDRTERIADTAPKALRQQMRGIAGELG